MSRVYEALQGDVREIEGQRKEELIQEHWGRFKKPMRRDDALNECHVKIGKLTRNRDLMLAFLVVKVGERADKTLAELRSYLANNGGFVEEV